MSHAPQLPPGHDIDPADVTEVRAGNAIWPGLCAFTGVSFLVYLLVKVAAGQMAADVAGVAQIAFSAVMLGVGGAALRRGRYFYVAAETRHGARRVLGLTKSEQTRLAARLRGETG